MNLDFFTGISRRNLNDVQDKYNIISEEDKKRLLKKIEVMLCSKSDTLANDVVNCANEVVKTIGSKYK